MLWSSEEICDPKSFFGRKAGFFTVFSLENRRLHYSSTIARDCLQLSSFRDESFLYKGAQRPQMCTIVDNCVHKLQIVALSMGTYCMRTYCMRTQNKIETIDQDMPLGDLFHSLFVFGASFFWGGGRGAVLLVYPSWPK